MRVAPESLVVPWTATISMPPGGISFSPDGFSAGGRIDVSVGAARSAVVVEPITGRVRRE